MVALSWGSGKKRFITAHVVSVDLILVKNIMRNGGEMKVFQGKMMS